MNASILMRFRWLRVALTLASMALLASCASSTEPEAGGAPGDMPVSETGEEPAAGGEGSTAASLEGAAEWKYEIVDWRVVIGSEYPVHFAVGPDSFFYEEDGSCQPPALDISWGVTDRSYRGRCLAGPNQIPPGASWECAVGSDQLVTRFLTSRGLELGADEVLCVFDGDIALVGPKDSTEGFRTVAFASVWAGGDDDSGWADLTTSGYTATPEDAVVSITGSEVRLTIPLIEELESAGEGGFEGTVGLLLDVRLSPV